MRWVIDEDNVVHTPWCAQHSGCIQEYKVRVTAEQMRENLRRHDLANGHHGASTLTECSTCLPALAEHGD